MYSFYTQLIWFDLIRLKNFGVGYSLVTLCVRCQETYFYKSRKRRSICFLRFVKKVGVHV